MQEAEEPVLSAHDALAALLGKEDPTCLAAVASAASLRRQSGRKAEALALYRAAARDAVRGADRSTSFEFRQGIVDVLLELDRVNEAVHAGRGLVSRCRRAGQSEAARTARALETLAGAIEREAGSRTQGGGVTMPTEAEFLLREAAHVALCLLLVH